MIKISVQITRISSRDASVSQPEQHTLYRGVHPLQQQ